MRINNMPSDASKYVANSKSDLLTPAIANDKPDFSNKTSKFNKPQEVIDKLEQTLGEKALKKMGIIDCETCSSRKYKDDSDDSGVSFQAPTHISPQSSAAVVFSHEMEHVRANIADAIENDKEILHQSVTLHSDICSECGISYVSGGVTKSLIKDSQDNPETNKTKENPLIAKGLFVDAYA